MEIYRWKNDFLKNSKGQNKHRMEVHNKNKMKTLAFSGISSKRLVRLTRSNNDLPSTKLTISLIFLSFLFFLFSLSPFILLHFPLFQVRIEAEQIGKTKSAKSDNKKQLINAPPLVRAMKFGMRASWPW